MGPRRSAQQAGETRRAIVARAVDLASLQGLEGLTIGRLAGELHMSKAGVIGHFGSKEELQLAALAGASEIFRAEVWDRAASLAPGRERLAGICEAWISYLERGVFPGGCFLNAASCEFDGRPGRVHDAVADTLTRWRSTLEAEARTAISAGELPPGSDPAVLAFMLSSIALGVNQAIQLYGERSVGGVARSQAAALLGLDTLAPRSPQRSSRAARTGSPRATRPPSRTSPKTPKASGSVVGSARR
ncbi:MAG: TetR/AcrR family transcriptional regulator [Acidobacteriota bacterium]|nr:TetR/AcrR family transcriptional regulator [Acidobacteriota bacterium]